jgi:hypothetical protein
MNFLRSVIALCSGFVTYRPYRDVALTASLKYLLKLIMLLALVLAISAVPPALERIDAFARRFDDRRPEFAIKDGKIVSQAPQPYSWGTKDVRFILDTTGAVTTPDSNATAGVLFTADSFLYWLTPTNDSVLAWAASTNGTTNATMIISTPPQSLHRFPDAVVNGDFFRHLIRAMLWLLVPLGWLVLVLFGMLSCLLQAYLFSVVASFMERSMPAPLQLPQLLNIAIHACTPAAIVVTLYSIMRLHDLSLWLVYLIIYGIFIIGASIACRDPVNMNRRETREDNLL